MLIGHYTVKLTDKNRVALPARYREEIGESAIIAKWYEGCLVIVSKDKWDEIIVRLTGRAKILSEPVRDIDRFILGSAFEVRLDAQGRFVMPKVLGDYAKLKKDIVFVGLGNRIEVWDKEIWQKQEKYVQDNASELTVELSKEYKE